MLLEGRTLTQYKLQLAEDLSLRRPSITTTGLSSISFTLMDGSAEGLWTVLRADSPPQVRRARIDTITLTLVGHPRIDDGGLQIERQGRQGSPRTKAEIESWERCVRWTVARKKDGRGRTAS